MMLKNFLELHKSTRVLVIKDVPLSRMGGYELACEIAEDLINIGFRYLDKEILEAVERADGVIWIWLKWWKSCAEDMHYDESFRRLKTYAE